jgi:hypothetical protein
MDNLFNIMFKIIFFGIIYFIYIVWKLKIKLIILGFNIKLKINYRFKILVGFHIWDKINQVDKYNRWLRNYKLISKIIKIDLKIY